MKNLRLYMADFDKEKGYISYSVEDEAGNRVDFAEYTDDKLKTYDLKVMDLFLLSYLPKLMLTRNSILVRGPISKTLANNLILFKEKLIKSRMGNFYNVNVFFEEITDTIYFGYDIEKIKDVSMSYLRDENLNEALVSAIKYYS